MNFEHALIARICHDLITPFNAINLGMEAYEASGDSTLLNSVKESVEKANVILKFIRELHATRSDSFCYSRVSLRQMLGDFLRRFSISISLESDFENIPNIAAKIIMYNSILAKEIMPFGGIVNVRINDESGEIVTICSGKNVTAPSFDENGECNHKNVMRVSLLKLLKESGFKIVAYQDGNQIMIREQMIS
ncbi:MAG: hypothetical protein LBJ71_01425 [Holosporaceae bacterium]|nr:hypothetical protein [Holosporaceae bacterium]